MLTIATAITATALTLVLAACIAVALSGPWVPVNRDAYRRAQAEWRTAKREGRYVL